MKNWKHVTGACVTERRLPKVLRNATSIRVKMGESASEKLGRALRTLSEAVDADEQLSQLYTQLADVDNLLNDFNHELAEYQKKL